MSNGNMFRYRVRGYTNIDNAVFFTHRLSAGAKGCFCQMLSLPDDWTFTVPGFKEQFTDSEYAIRKYLKELEGKGFLIRAREHAEGGRFAKGCVWVAVDDPAFYRAAYADLEVNGLTVLSARAEVTCEQAPLPDDFLMPQQMRRAAWRRAEKERESRPNRNTRAPRSRQAKPQVGTKMRNTQVGSDQGIVENSPENGPVTLEEDVKPQVRTNCRNTKVGHKVSDINKKINPSLQPSPSSQPGAPAAAGSDGRTGPAGDEARRCFAELSRRSVNQNLLRGPQGRARGLSALAALLDSGLAPKDVESAWAARQRLARAEGREDRYFPQLIAWLESDAENGAAAMAGRSSRAEEARARKRASAEGRARLDALSRSDEELRGLIEADARQRDLVRLGVAAPETAEETRRAVAERISALEGEEARRA